VGLDATSDLRAGDLAARLRSAPGVEAVSVASAVPGRFMINLGLEPTNFSSEAAITTEEAGGYVSFSPAQVDAAYLQALGLEVVAGRGFTEEDAERPGTPVYVLNEAAARALGWTPEEAVGKPFSIGSGQPEGAVIGVVRDFHVRSMHQAIPAVSLQLHAPTTWGSGNTLVARLSADGIRTGMEQVKARLAEVAPEVPFEYTFLDDTFDAMYRAEERLGHVFGLFAAVAIAVACLGLFGLATYAAETRTKEIGIRKALGASAAQVVQLLTREFAALVAVAFVLGVPAAYVAMAQWLEAFAYRVALGPSFFAGAGALALVVALATVGTQALRAARTDPARALRSE
jgi:putative ABC transport system permease protein